MERAEASEGEDIGERKMAIVRVHASKFETFSPAGKRVQKREFEALEGK